MKRALRLLVERRPSPALVVACVALFVALAGTGVAAVVALVPNNSVGTAQLRNNAVVSAKVKDHSLAAKDFANGQLPAGPAGATGATGATGPIGPGITSWAIVKANGTLDKASGVTAVTRTAVGTYNVAFAVDVTNCSLLASAGSDSASSKIRGAIANFNRTTTPTIVQVTTSTGTTAGDRAFSLAAICPPPPAATTTTTTTTTTPTTTTPTTTTRTTTTTPKP
ncbi:MAG TPA: hypothetical protein VJ375_09540 [Gaiellaceae bacterium]|jgi:hypothetical protein|nr:hypothetical protein [Gaiellaceae bacterium]